MVPLLLLVKFTCVAVLTTFQLASTAFTVTLKGTPAFWPIGLPVLPVIVPAAAVSPGIRICNFVTAPRAGVREADVPVIAPPSVSVSVVATALFKVTLKVAEPLENVVAVPALGENVLAVGPVSVMVWLLA